MDVHKEKIVVAESKTKGQSEIIGEYENTQAGLKKMIKMLSKRKKENEIKICYEAGPCGFAVKRILNKSGFSCEVIAPSLIPVQGGNRVKTDQRDAKKLARYYQAGELTMIYVPDEEQESVRNLVRSREDVKEDIRRYKQRIGHFLLRNGIKFSGKSNWTEMYKTWVKKIQLKTETDQFVLEHYMNTLEMLELQQKEQTEKIEEMAKTEEYKEKVNALCAYRGIGTLTAMIFISEIVDFRRFRSPKELMAYLGMTPSEYSSGGKERKGSITKCGNSRVRKALVESAWHYVKKPIISKLMRDNLESVPKELRKSPLTALKRLHKRYFYLVLKGKSRQKAIVATARELSGFIWATMVELESQRKDLLMAA